MSKSEEKPFWQVGFHSYVVIPMVIAVSCVALFTAVQLLTREHQSVYDLLEDVKVGGATKRWQSAFELSKMLSNPDLIPKEDAFVQEVANAFKKSKEDDPRVRQYLALAMGRTGNRAFFEPLREGLSGEKEENLPAVLYAIGMLKDPRGAAVLYPYLEHRDPRVRSIAVTAVGNIAHPSSVDKLKKALVDAEPNVQWGAAVSLAKMGNRTGKTVLLKMLDRKYLSLFPQVDPEEQDYLMLAAIDASSLLNEPELNAAMERLSQTDSNMKIRSAAMEKLR